MKYPTYEIEEELLAEGYSDIAGVDEVGRGPGVGPVVAAAVKIPINVLPELIGRVKDSKKMTVRQRNLMAPMIMSYCKVGIGLSSNDIIDKINILEATKRAMLIAVAGIETDYLLVDGDYKMKLDDPIPQKQIPKGDSLSISIAAASIVAKVYRDDIMKQLHEIYPVYNWKNNKGYLTREHIEAIKRYGITEYHRKSFRKVGR